MGSRVRALDQITFAANAIIRTVKMQTKLIVFTLLVCFLVGCYAPFPRSDPRSVLNPFIEPWWCRVPKIMREFLHLKFTFSPLNERGPCTVPSGRFNGYLEHPVVPASSQPACHSVLLLPHSSTACKMFLTNHENAKKFLNLIRFKLVMSVLSLIAIY